VKVLIGGSDVLRLRGVGNPDILAARTGGVNPGRPRNRQDLQDFHQDLQESFYLYQNLQILNQSCQSCLVYRRLDRHLGLARFRQRDDFTRHRLAI